MYNSAKCGAWITQKKNRKSIKNGNIYLPNSSEFEIELFNPTKVTVLAKITMNGINATRGGMILKPGQRIYLDCFVESKKKFTFNTYDVSGNDAEVAQAIADNGTISVSFYDEDTMKYNYNNYGNWQVFTTPTVWYSSDNIGSGTPRSLYSSTVGGTNMDGILRSSTITTSSVSMDSVSLGMDNTEDKSVETGRIEGGKKSDQDFDLVDMDFNSFAHTTIKYTILPESRKPVEPKELAIYCTQCGRKAKKNDNFCASCGNKI